MSHFPWALGTVLSCLPNQNANMVYTCVRVHAGLEALRKQKLMDRHNRPCALWHGTCCIPQPQLHACRRIIYNNSRRVMRRAIYGASVARALLPLHVTAGAAGAALGTGPGGAPGERVSAAPTAASAAANGSAGSPETDRQDLLNGLGTGDASEVAGAGAPDHRASQPATGEAAADGGGAGAAADVEAGIDDGPQFVAEARSGNTWSAMPEYMPHQLHRNAACVRLPQLIMRRHSHGATLCMS